MKILGVELDFDFCDADQVEVYEREARRAAERVQDKKQYEGKGNAEGIRAQCRIMDEFFDTVFGTGTAGMLFHGKANLREHLEAFGAVSDAARQSADGLRGLAGRYAPGRAARGQGQEQQKRVLGPGYVSASGYSILDGDLADPTGPKGIPDVSATDGQAAFIEKFIQMMPEMEAFMQAHRNQQGNGANG